MSTGYQTGVMRTRIGPVPRKCHLCGEIVQTMAPNLRWCDKCRKSSEAKQRRAAQQKKHIRLKAAGLTQTYERNMAERPKWGK